MKLYDIAYPELIFSSDPKYNIDTLTYQAIWTSMGKSIIKAFTVFSHLTFTEKKIIVKIGEGDEKGKNNPGKSIGSPMLFRYNVRNKFGTMVHELGHRLIMEHDYFNRNKDLLKIIDDHQLLNLFLFDAMAYVFGKEAALFRVQYESSFPDGFFDKWWKWALKKSKKERQIILIKLANDYNTGLTQNS